MLWFGGAFPWVSAALFLGSLAGLLLVVLGRWLRRQPGLRRTPLDLALVVLLGVMLCQLLPLPVDWLQRLAPWNLQQREHALGPQVAAQSWPLSLHPEAGFERFVHFAGGALVFLLAAALPRRRASLLRLTAGLLLLGCFEAGYGLLERYGGRDHIWHWAKNIGSGTLSGTFVNRNHFAALLAPLVPLAIGVGLAVWPGSRRGHRLPLRVRISRLLDQPRSWHALLAWGAAALMMLCVVLSSSRGGLLAAGVGIAGTALALWGRGRRRTSRLRVLAALVAVLATTWLAVREFGTEDLEQRFENLAEELQEGAPLRRRGLALNTLRMIGNSPWLGVGAGAWESVNLVEVPTWTPRTIVNHAHSDLLQLPAELGLPAGLIFGLGLLSLLAGLLRARGRAEPGVQRLLCGLFGALLALLARSLVGFEQQLAGNLALTACLAGLAVAASQLHAPWRGARVGQLLLGLVLAVPLAWGLLWADLGAHPDLIRSRELRPPAERVAMLESALRWRPHAPALLYRLARARTEAWTEALDEAARQHSGRAEDAALTPLLSAVEAAYRRAQADSTRAVLTRAQAELERAIAGDPCNPDYHVLLAQLLAQQPDPPLGLLLRAARACEVLFPAGSQPQLDCACALLSQAHRLEQADRRWAIAGLARALLENPRQLERVLEQALGTGFLPEFALAMPRQPELWRQLAETLFARGLDRSGLYALDAHTLLLRGEAGIPDLGRAPQRWVAPPARLLVRLEQSDWRGGSGVFADLVELSKRSTLRAHCQIPEATERLVFELELRALGGGVLCLEAEPGGHVHLQVHDGEQRATLELPGMPEPGPLQLELSLPEVKHRLGPQRLDRCLLRELRIGTDG